MIEISDIYEIDELISRGESSLMDAERAYEEAKDMLWRLEGTTSEALQADINHSLDRIFGGSPAFRSLLDIAESMRVTLSRALEEAEEMEELESREEDEVVSAVVHRLKEASMVKTAPPQWVVDEDIWDDAKDAVMPYKNKYKEWYGAVTKVYKNMGGRISRRRRKGAADIIFVNDRVVNNVFGAGVVIDMEEDPSTGAQIAKVDFDSGEVEWTLIEDLVKEELWNELAGEVAQ